MVRIWTILLGLCIAALAAAQTYSPRAGETVLRLAVEGRGDIFIRLNTSGAPRITSRIAALARSGFYNGQRFHRVVKSPKPYLVQVGDPASRSKLEDSMTGGSGTKLGFEDSGMRNTAGAVGLAADPNTKQGDSQFYILLADQTFLDGKYPVFGQVVAGMEIVRKIERGDKIVSATILGG